MENKIFFGFALADSMFVGNVTIIRKAISVDDVRKLAEEDKLTPCINSSHQATINAMTTRYGIQVPIPATPPKVSLGVGDSIIVMGVRGLPRLTDRHEYTQDEIDAATFSFAQYTVVAD